jgi:hypothetical protein
MKHGTQILLVFCLAVTPAGCGGRTELEAPPEVVRDEDRQRFVGRWRGTAAESIEVVTIDCEPDPRFPGFRDWQPRFGVIPDAFIRTGSEPQSIRVVNQLDVADSFDDSYARPQPARLISRTRAEFEPVWTGRGYTTPGGQIGRITGTLTLEGEQLVIRGCWIGYSPGLRDQTFGFRGTLWFRKIE